MNENAFAALVDGIHRADSAERRAGREVFVEELLSAVVVYPLMLDVARLAGRLDAEQQSRGVVIPFADLLIGATAPHLGYSVFTGNRRHFERIPGLSVIQLSDLSTDHSETLIGAKANLAGFRARARPYRADPGRSIDFLDNAPLRM